MARPTKRGLDYFPLNVDFFSDEKVVCISGEFGVKGEIIVLRLLCAVYRNGYFVEWNEALRLSLAHEMHGVSAELIAQVTQRAIKWGLFDQALFEKDAVLTSPAIQRRYFSAKRITAPPPDLPYLLVSATKTPVIATKTPVIATKTPVSATKTPIKEKEITTTSTTPKPPRPDPPPPAAAPAALPAAAATVPGDFIAGTPPGPGPAPALSPDIAGIYADDAWLDLLQVSTATPKARLRELLADFDTHCRLNCKLPLESPAEARRYFRYWLNYQLKKTPQNAKPTTTDRPDPPGRTGPQGSRRRPSLGFGLHKD